MPDKNMHIVYGIAAIIGIGCLAWFRHWLFFHSDNWLRLRRARRLKRQERKRDLEDYRRKRSEIYARLLKRAPAIVLLAWACVGCAHFASRTYEEGVDAAGKPINRTTHMYITTFFDSNTALAKAKNSPTIVSSNQWAAGTTIGGLNQDASGTNAVAMLQAISQILSQVAAGAASGLK